MKGMAKIEYAIFTALLFLLFSPYLFAGVTSAAGTVTGRSHPNPVSADINFIRSSCGATRYPALCFHCLSGYAASVRRSDHRLAQAALLISLSRARSATAFVTRLARSHALGPWDHGVVRDCVENMGDTGDQLSQSVRELGGAGQEVGQDFDWHMSNVQTWVSAALTDENTCMDGFAGRAAENRRVKVAVRRLVVDVAQVTSNALALVNRFASRH